jgi:lantibiotic modifying enzyme
VLTGMAGAIVPLLYLADTTADPRWRAEAVIIGDRLAAAAILDHDKARWPGLRSDYGLGGFAHGSVGIGWALARLGRATRLDRFTTLADAAFAFQDSLYDPDRGGWRDLRKPDALAANWCYGCDGVGIAAADLATDADPRWHRLLDRAAAAAQTTGFGATHTLCHGDLGSAEVLTAALHAGVAPAGVSRQQLDANLISSLEEYGPSCAMTNRLFRPGLLSGTTGVAYHLLRMHPEAALPSLLLPDPGAGVRP